MKKLLIPTLLAAILALCFTGKPIHSQVADAPAKFKVAVFVSESNDDTDSEKSLKT